MTAASIEYDVAAVVGGTRSISGRWTNLAAGSLTGLTIDGAIGSGTIYVVGATAAATAATGVVSGTCGSGTTSTSLVKPTGAANWTSSNLIGKWVKVTGGGGYSSGRPVLRYIYANSTTALSIQTLTGADSTTQFEIVTLASVAAEKFRISNCDAPVSISAINFSTAGLARLLEATDCRNLTLTGCSFSGLSTSTDVLLTRVRNLTLNHCFFSSSTELSCSQSDLVSSTGIYLSAGGPISFSLCDSVGVNEMIARNAVSFALQIADTRRAFVELDANDGAVSACDFSDVARLTATGTMLVGTGNGGFGVNISGGGRYTMTGSTITGTSGDVSLLGNATTWANLSSASYGIAEEHATAAIANAAYTKAIKYGSYLYNGNIDVSGRLLCYGYLNQATKLSGVTAAGTTIGDATNLATEGALSFAEVSTTPAGSGVILPGNAAIAGHFVTVYNSGANTLTIYAPSGGTVDGGASTTLATTKVATFVSLNGASGKNFVKVSGT